MTINIGCGSNTWGDVRLDYSKRPKEYYLNSKPSANLIADAQQLPFVDKCFSELRALHVLEHVRDWKKALKEWCRVSLKVTIRFPTNSNVAVIFIKCLLQDLDLHQVNLIPHNLKSMLRLKEQSNEHLWQIEPRRIMDEIKFHGFKHCIANKVNVPILQLKVPFLRSSLRTVRFTLPHSWDITAWR